MKFSSIGLATGLGLGLLASTAHAQSSVTMYGTVDQYLSYLKSSSGTSSTALEDGTTRCAAALAFAAWKTWVAATRPSSSWRAGLNADSGTSADANRGFDRQAWVGIATPYEFRAGRQNSAIFYRGDYIDFTSRWARW